MESTSHDERARKGAALLARFQRRKGAQPKAQRASTTTTPQVEQLDPISSPTEHSQAATLQEREAPPAEPSSSTTRQPAILVDSDRFVAPASVGSDHELLEARRQLHDSDASVQLLKRQLARAEAHARDMEAALQDQDTKQSQALRAQASELEVLEEDNAELHKKLVSTGCILGALGADNSCLESLRSPTEHQC